MAGERLGPVRGGRGEGGMGAGEKGGGTALL
jgi:hypothetical protein